MKKLFFLLLMINLALAAFAQARPRLGILPFTGGAGGDGETIATLFSFQNDIRGAFTVVPRTSAVNALVAEQTFQLSGYTDSDTIARLGRMLNADFVVSGHIRRLGNRNLVITTIVNVETFEQLAGDYREYGSIEEVENLLPDIARIIINAARRDTSGLPKLAVVPFNIANQGVAAQDAEVLAQILAVEITNSGRYAVLPRLTTMQAALRELEFQMTGATAEEEAKALGRAINAEYVLSGEVRSLGATNMFTASILNVEDGSLFAGNYRNYRTISDGIRLMAELARLLTAGVSDSALSENPAQDPASSHTKVPVAERASRLWTVGVSAGSSLAAPLVIATVQGTVAPLRYSFLQIGCDIGFFSGAEDTGYYSLYPFAHYALFLPFARKGGWYMGAGGGYLSGEYSFPEGKVPVNILAFNVITGFNIGDVFDISYTLRTNFTGISNKIAVGYTYRFK